MDMRFWDNALLANERPHWRFWAMRFWAMRFWAMHFWDNALLGHALLNHVAQKRMAQKRPGTESALYILLCTTALFLLWDAQRRFSFCLKTWSFYSKYTLKSTQRNCTPCIFFYQNSVYYFRCYLPPLLTVTLFVLSEIWSVRHILRPPGWHQYGARNS